MNLPFDLHSFTKHLSFINNLILQSISIKDFVREKKSATEKRKSNRNFLLMKLNTKSLKFKSGLADKGVGGGGDGLVDPCKAWVPPPSNK
jgi:hypothetical protein